MNKPNVDDILQQGIHGPKEFNPEERRQFLGTLRERIVVVLTQEQVRSKGIFPGIESFLKENPGAHLLFNGNIAYSVISKYVKLAKKYNLSYKMVTNKEYDSEIGLVLAYYHAIDKQEIFIRNDKPEVQAVARPGKKKRLSSLFGKIFHK
jgi:uncharacterized protein YueI